MWLLGAVAGVLLAPHLVAHIAAPRAKLFAALFLILALVVVGEVAGVVLGRAVRGAIYSNSIRFFDSLVGVAVQLVVVLVAAWLLATPLTSSAGQPSLAAAVRRFTGAGEVERLCAAVAEDGAQAVVGAAGHLGSAAGTGAVQPNPRRGGRRPGLRAGQESRSSRAPNRAW